MRSQWNFLNLDKEEEGVPIRREHAHMLYILDKIPIIRFRGYVDMGEITTAGTVLDYGVRTPFSCNDGRDSLGQVTDARKLLIDLTIPKSTTRKTIPKSRLQSV
ncbi:hypothetical protein J6590_056919 [Homalodisca vitripennis]|nr:hypothetical protein J6590_056919 [Homalodisca vitripennis]